MDEFMTRIKETVLVASRDDALRRFVVGELESDGYSAIEAEDGFAALRASERTVGPIHLLITDTSPGGLHGHELARRIGEERHGISVVFMSHLDPSVRLGDRAMAPGFHHLRKPFSKKKLIEKVREAVRPLPTGTS